MSDKKQGKEDCKKGELVFKVITLICAGVCLGLILHMLGGGLFGTGPEVSPIPSVSETPLSSPSPSPTQSEITLTDAEAEQAISAYIKSAIGEGETTAALHSGGRLEITLSVGRDAFRTAVENAGGGLSASHKIALSLLPEKVDMAAGFALSIAPESGRLSLKADSLTAAGTAIEPSLLPEKLCEGLAEALSTKLLGKSGTLSSLEVCEGYIKAKVSG